jgi:hypothetical protein
MTLLLENGKHPSTKAVRDCPECDGVGIITHPEWKDWFEGRVLAGILYAAREPKHPKETICKCTEVLQLHSSNRTKGARPDARPSMIGRPGYGLLTVTGLSEKTDPRKNKYVFADCACGTKQVEVKAFSVRCGDTKSCGCLRRPKRSALRSTLVSYHNAINR